MGSRVNVEEDYVNSRNAAHRNIEQAFQQAHQLGYETDGSRSANPVHDLVAKINSQLRTDSSPYVLVPMKPEQASADQRRENSKQREDSEQREGSPHQLVDIRTGKRVEQFAIHLNGGEITTIADAFNRAFVNGTFGDKPVRDVLAAHLRNLYRSEGMAGIYKLTDRIFVPGYQVNIIGTPVNGQLQFRGLSLSRAGNPGTISDFLGS
jgi:hypothetical protein